MAVSVYCITQAKRSPHFLGTVNLFLTLANSLEHICGKVVVFHIIEAALDDFPQIECLCAPSLSREEIESLLDIRSQSN